MHSGKKLPLTLALLCSIGVFTTACSSGGSDNEPTPPPTGNNGNGNGGGEDPGNDEPGDDEPGNDEPGDGEPGDDEPGDDEPGDEEPGDDEPGDEEPGDDEPGDDEPGDGEPGSGDPGGIPDRGGDPGLPLSNWTWVYPQPMGYTLNDVIADSNQFVAIGNRGALLTSVDGEQWDVRHLGGATLRAISYNGDLYVAVGGEGDVTSGGVIYYSQDGNTWERAARNLQTGSLDAVAWTGNDFIALGREASTHLRSDDGETWDKVGSGPDIAAYALAADNSTLVAGGLSALFRSADGGDTWSEVHAPEGSPGNFNAVLFDGERFVAAGAASLGGFSTSSNGGTWSTDPDDVSYANTGGSKTFTAVIRTGDHYWLTDTNGRVHQRDVTEANWSVQSGELASDLNGIAHLDGTFVTVGTAGALWRSDNGSDWANQQTASMDAGSSLRAIAANDSGRLIAVGHQRLFYTDDGDSWAAGTIDTAQFFNAATWTGTRYVAAGVFAIAHSLDGIEWTRSSDAGAITFAAVAGKDDQWLAMNSNPNASPQLVSCTPTDCTEVDAGPTNLRQLIHNGEDYWVINEDGYVYKSANGDQWQPAGQPLSEDGRLLAASDNIIVAASSNQTQENTRYTTDGGANWQSASFPEKVQISGATLTSDDEGFLLYDNSRSTLWRSSDGASWSAERMPHYINSLVRVGEQVYIINLNGHILRQ